MPSFSIALTGLKADSVALNTIGNNLANLNTTAFKKQTASFSDLFYQTIGVSGADSPLQVGVGTKIGTIATDYSQGSLATTTNSTDMAINGDGFFVVSDGGVQQLTRSGNFQLDSSGNLITSSGLAVMGYPATNGVINGNTSIAPLNIPTGQTQAAQATTQFSTTAVLNATSSVGTSFATSTTMYDSLGEGHSLTTTFTKTADNTWGYAVTLPPGTAATTTGNTGTLVFNTNGSLLSPTASVANIGFHGLSDASSDVSLTWKLYDVQGDGLITQSATTSSANSSSQNGYTSGKYKNFSVDSVGQITAFFSNGNSQQLGQLAVASVSNTEGLTRTGNDLYLAGHASGLASVGVASTGGRGAVQDSSIEQSNVDISSEFADLIVAQRAFEANSKTITAFDSVTQETINLIR